MAKKKTIKGFDFYDADQWWKDEWQDMPEFISEDKTAFRTILIHFNDQKSVDEFAKLVDQNISDRTKYIYYPKIEIETMMNKRYIDKGEK